MDDLWHNAVADWHSIVADVAWFANTIWLHPIAALIGLGLAILFMAGAKRS
jgi:hypothetical protein